MLHYLLSPYISEFPTLRLINYISFRAAGAAVTSLLVAFIVGPLVLARLRSMAVHQVVREGTPDSHAGKGTTPTMGGIIILIGCMAAVALALVMTLIFERALARPLRRLGGAIVSAAGTNFDAPVVVEERDANRDAAQELVVLRSAQQERQNSLKTNWANPR